MNTVFFLAQRFNSPHHSPMQSTDSVTLHDQCAGTIRIVGMQTRIATANERFADLSSPFLEFEPIKAGDSLRSPRANAQIVATNKEIN